MRNAKNIAKHSSIAVLSIALCGLAITAAVQAQQNNPEQALREIGIMRNIFDAALDANVQNPNGQRGRFRMGPPEALYLAGQGMVFTFHMNGSGMNLIVGPGTGITIPAVPAMPAVVYADSDDFNFDFDFDFDFDYDYDAYGTEDSGVAAVARAQYREQVNEMNQAIRDRQEELQDAQREIRQLQRQERGNPDADNDDEIDRLEASIETLVQDLQNQANAMQKLQGEYLEKRVAAFEAVRTQQTDVIFDTLCVYGNTLRSLASGEHVTIVLRNYADNQTQVNVLDYADISGCTSAATLRQAATSYVQDNQGF